MPECKPTIEKLQHLEVRLYRLTTRSHLTIGSGEAAELTPVDKPIIRALFLEEGGEQQRVPYLPASSLHGVIRAWVEKALRSLNSNEAKLKEKFGSFEPSDSTAKANLKNMIARDLETLGYDRQALLDDEDVLFQAWQVYPNVCNPFWEHDKCEVLGDEEAVKVKKNWLRHLEREIPCHVCRIFGYPGQRGRVRFTHGFPGTPDIPRDFITRVAINRYTGAADAGKLFDLEAVAPGVVFHFFVIIENLEKQEKDHFDYGIKALNFNLATLGAFSTVGFGLVEVDKVVEVKLKPEIFKLEALPIDAAPNLFTYADLESRGYDRRRYPEFFNLLARLKKNGLPDLLTDKMVEVVFREES